MADAVLTRVRRIVGALFEVPVEQIDEATSSKTLERWDSMGHLSLILELEQEFGVALPPEQVEKMLDVGSIVKVLESKSTPA